MHDKETETRRGEWVAVGFAASVAARLEGLVVACRQPSVFAGFGGGIHGKGNLRLVVSLFFLFALIGGTGSCRRRGAGSRRRSQAERKIRLPGVVPENAVGLALADGRWLVSAVEKVWARRDGGSLDQFLRGKLHLDISKLGMVWVVWFPGEQAGPLLFDPVVVVQGARFLGSWGAVIEGRGVQRLVSGLDAMDCGTSVCLGARGSLVSVARAMRGERRARPDSDFWAGVLRFLSTHRKGLASVMDLSGRFPTGPSMVRLDLSRSGRLTVTLLGSAVPQETMSKVKQLLERAARATSRHSTLPGARRAARVLSAARLRIAGRAVILEMDGVLVLLRYALSSGQVDVAQAP